MPITERQRELRRNHLGQLRLDGKPFRYGHHLTTANVHEYVTVKPETGCWEWNLSRDKRNYGIAWLQQGNGGSQVAAHRATWILFNGPIPAGMFVCHRCDNPPCCNPSHLFLGTHEDNMADCIAKGRFKPGWVPGERNGRATITSATAKQIYRAYHLGGTSHRRLAREFGVSRDIVRRIVRGQNWKTATKELVSDN
jgi:hypothetical protein